MPRLCADRLRVRQEVKCKTTGNEVYVAINRVKVPRTAFFLFFCHTRVARCIDVNTIDTADTTGVFLDLCPTRLLWWFVGAVEGRSGENTSDAPSPCPRAPPEACRVLVSVRTLPWRKSLWVSLIAFIPTNKQSPNRQIYQGLSVKFLLNSRNYDMIVDMHILRVSCGERISRISKVHLDKKQYGPPCGMLCVSSDDCLLPRCGETSWAGLNTPHG